MIYSSEFGGMDVRPNLVSDFNGASNEYDGIGDDQGLDFLGEVAGP